MKILLWLGLALVVIAITPFIVLFVNLVFLKQVTEVKSQWGADYEEVEQGITINELANDSGEVMDAEGILDKSILQSDLPVSIEMSLTADGKLKKSDGLFADEAEKSVLQLLMPQKNEQLIFMDNSVYIREGDGLGEKRWQFDEFKDFRFVSYIDENTLLIIASMMDSQYVETQLWQINLQDLSKILLSSDPYYSFNRPPKVLRLVDSGAVLAIYYSGDYSFAYGGPASRPQKSTARIYSSKYPTGYDLVSINYKGGTVFDARLDQGKLVLSADPSRPYMVDDRERPARFWQVSGFEQR